MMRPARPAGSEAARRSLGCSARARWARGSPSSARGAEHGRCCTTRSAKLFERGLTRAREGLQKEAAKGRLDPDAAAAASARLTAVDGLAEFADCDLVIEAAPERIELKHELYGALAEVVSSDCVLASNTSSLPVTKIASGVSHPERVVGMHFFNPAPIMKLLEDHRGGALGRALARARRRDGEGDGQGHDQGQRRARLPREPL